jgi:membrane protease YdiL (CAAX protease family)
MVELAFAVVGLAIIVVSGHSIGSAYAAPVNPIAAVAGGVALGGVLGSVAGIGLRRPELADRVRPFLARFTSSAATPVNFAILGLAAAIGEETLFRAAIQPVTGIVIAAVLFTVAHAPIADLRHLTPGKLAYVGLALGMGLLLGLLYDRFGIAASVGAHAAFDTAVLLWVRPLLPDVPTSVRARPEAV